MVQPSPGTLRPKPPLASRIPCLPVARREGAPQEASSRGHTRLPRRTLYSASLHPVSPPRPRLWLHLLLFVATGWSLALAAWITWAGGFEEIAREDSVRGMGGALLAAAVRWDVLRAGGPYALTVLAILGAHEMGHYLACRIYGIPATLPFFIPGIVPFGTFGAVIRVRGVVPHRKALFDVAAAGPLAGFAIGLLALLAGSVAAEGAPSPLGRSLLVRLLELG